MLPHLFSLMILLTRTCCPSSYSVDLYFRTDGLSLQQEGYFEKVYWEKCISRKCDGEGYFEKVWWEKGISRKRVGRREFRESVAGEWYFRGNMISPLFPLFLWMGLSLTWCPNARFNDILLGNIWACLLNWTPVFLELDVMGLIFLLHVISSRGRWLSTQRLCRDFHNNFLNVRMMKCTEMNVI